MSLHSPHVHSRRAEGQLYLYPLSTPTYSELRLVKNARTHYKVSVHVHLLCDKSSEHFYPAACHSRSSRHTITLDDRRGTFVDVNQWVSQRRSLKITQSAAVWLLAEQCPWELFACDLCDTLSVTAICTVHMYCTYVLYICTVHMYNWMTNW